MQVSFDSFSVEQKEVDEQGEEILVKYITIDKLQEAFEYIGAASDIADIKMLINDVDENGDGKIDFDEWMSIMGKKFLGEDDDASTVHVFSMLDDNKDGYIPLVELRSLLMREGQAPLSEQEVDELLMFADADSDGLVNYRSFLAWLANPYEVKKKPAASLPPSAPAGRGRRDIKAKAAAKDLLRASATEGSLGAPAAEFGPSVDAPAASTTPAPRRPTPQERRQAAATKEPGEASNAPPSAAAEGTAAPAGDASAPAGNDRAALRAQRQQREKEKAEKEKAERAAKRQERQEAQRARNSVTSQSGTGEGGNEP